MTIVHGLLLFGAAMFVLSVVLVGRRARAWDRRRRVRAEIDALEALHHPKSAA